MKKSVLLAVALCALMAPAISQEPKPGQMMFCDDSGCAWVDDPSMPQPPVTLHAPPGNSGWPVDPLTGLAQQPALIGSAPVTIYGYSPLSLPPAIDLKPPRPLCPPTRGQALAHFASGVASGDVNKVLSSYEWTSVPQADADRLIAQLSVIPAGSWQQRYVESSFDADFSTTTREPSFLWTSSTADTGLAFDLVEHTGCWFVKFSEDAPEPVAVVESVPQAPALENTAPAALNFQ